MSTKYDFHGKTVLVTGGSKGIGFGLVIKLAECGANVISLSKTTDSLEQVSSDRPDLMIDYRKCDIKNWKSTQESIKSILQLKTIDYLINNAGVALLSDFGNITEENINESFSINVKSVINISQIVSSDWKMKGTKGVIINVSSQASKRAIGQHSVYCATKAALDALTRNMALELGPFGIRVNSVNPTAILTDMGRLYWEEEGKCKSLTSRLPLGRLGEVNEVVEMVLYLLTDSASLVTGATIPLDAGFWAC